MLESSYLCTRFQNGSSDKLDILNWTRCAGLPPFFFCLPFAKRDDEEKENKKNFRKHLEDMLKSPYLCIRFPKRKATLKEAVFEQIYINNTSSTRARLRLLKKKRFGLG